MKKFQRDKEYMCSFKSDEDKSSMWIHIHCYMTTPVPGERRRMSDSDYIDWLEKRMGTAYQAMSLYDRVVNGQIVGGQFLAYIERLDAGLLRYLDIEAA